MVEIGCRRGEFRHHLAVQRVQRIRPVQRDRRDAILTVDEDGLVSHLRSPF
jgi:hypothetical protein